MLPACVLSDPAAFGTTIVDNDDGTAFVQIGYFDDVDGCNADVLVTSHHADADGNVVEELTTWSTDVNSLEAAAAGDGWVETDIEIDPCFASVDVAVVDDGVPTDVLATELFGDGCSIVGEGLPRRPVDSGHQPRPPSGVDRRPRARRGRRLRRRRSTASQVVTTWSTSTSVPSPAPTVTIDDAAPVAYPGGDVAVSVGQTVVFTNPAPDDDDDPEPGPDPQPWIPDDTLQIHSERPMTFGLLGLVSGLSGLGLVAAARRRHR